MWASSCRSSGSGRKEVEELWWRQTSRHMEESRTGRAREVGEGMRETEGREAVEGRQAGRRTKGKGTQIAR